MLYVRDLFDWLEPVLTGLALLVVALRPTWLGRLATAVGERSRTDGDRTNDDRTVGDRIGGDRGSDVRWLLGIGGASAAAAALVAAFHGLPAPRVSDEFAYRLQADTFAHGRLTMPTPPSPEHFETFFVLVEPTYASKYPPGQGLVLGAVQALFGHPAVGLWLLSGAFAASIYWALAGFVARPWALVGTVLALCRFGFMSYWTQSYWGGNLAAIGGALVWGSVARLVWPVDGRIPQPAGHGLTLGLSPGLSPGLSLGLSLGLGVAILANSRPLEGMIVSAPAAAVLAWWTFRAWRVGKPGPAIRCAAAAAAVLLAAAGAMALHNRAVTGDPLRLPYAEWESQYATVPNLSGRPLAIPSRPRPDQIERFYDALETQYDSSRPWIGTEAAVGRVLDTVRFFVGPGLLLAMIVGVARWRARPAIVMPALTLAALIAVQLVIRPWWPHYTAPATVLFLLPIVVGLERLWDLGPKPDSGSRWSGSRWSGAGRSLVVAVMVINAILLLPQWIERQRESRSWGHDRRALIRDLEGRPGNDLIFVRYGASHHPAREWVFNEADIPNSEVVWARDLGMESNRRLLASLGARAAWLLEVDREAGAPPRLVPYDARARSDDAGSE